LFPDKVLLVDDDPNVLNALRRTLGKFYHLGLAQDAEQAFILLETEGPFAAALCDLSMPGMNGLELLRELRRRDPGIIRMVLSGTGDMSTVIAAVNDGEIFRFHTKPVPTDVLLASIAAACDRHHHEAASSQSGPERSENIAAAIRNEEFRLFVQPQYDVLNRRVRGVEALARWQHPARGLLAPGAFLAQVETAGEMPRLTDWMLASACAAIAEWRETLDPDLAIAVNITANDLADPDFPARVAAAAASRDLPHGALELELVEGAALDADAVPLAALDRLAEMGIALSLDDFGTGYSAFARLRSLPVKKLKIDRIFVSDADIDDSALRIIQAIVSLGGDLDLSVIAEGVETAEQADALKRIGCKMVQGFLIAHPMPAADFPAWFRSRLGKP